MCRQASIHRIEDYKLGVANGSLSEHVGWRNAVVPRQADLAVQKEAFNKAYNALLQLREACGKHMNQLLEPKSTAAAASETA